MAVVKSLEVIVAVVTAVAAAVIEAVAIPVAVAITTTYSYTRVMYIYFKPSWVQIHHFHHRDLDDLGNELHEL